MWLKVPFSSRLQLPHRRVTFSTANPVQDQQDSSQQSYYDSGLEESETPSSKSSSGPRIGPLALPEDHYERTTPDGSIGEMEHPETGRSFRLLLHLIWQGITGSDAKSDCDFFCQHCFVLAVAWSMHLGSEADSAWSVSCPSASPQSQQQIILNDPLTQAC